MKLEPLSSSSSSTSSTLSLMWYVLRKFYLTKAISLEHSERARKSEQKTLTHSRIQTGWKKESRKCHWLTVLNIHPYSLHFTIQKLFWRKTHTEHSMLIRIRTLALARTLAHINHSAIRAHAKPIMLTCKRCRKFYFMKNDERKKRMK